MAKARHGFCGQDLAGHQPRREEFRDGRHAEGAASWEAEDLAIGQATEQASSWGQPTPPHDRATQRLQGGKERCEHVAGGHAADEQHRNMALRGPVPRAPSRRRAFGARQVSGRDVPCPQKGSPQRLRPKPGRRLETPFRLLAQRLGHDGRGA